MTNARPVRRLAVLIGEGLAIARTQMMPTSVTAAVIGLVCAVILSTVGQSAAVEAQILGRFDLAGARTIIVTDPTGEAEIFADSVEDLRGLSGVGWVVGFGPVTDVRNLDLGPAGRPVASRPMYGELPSEVSVSGRYPAEGEALVGSAAGEVLGLQQAVGAVSGANREYPVVGKLEAGEPLSFLNSGVVIARSPDRDPGARLRQIIVLAARVEDVAVLAEAIPQVVHARVPAALAVQAPSTLVELREVVSGELATNSRRLTVVVLGVGLVIVAVTLAGAVAQRSRDFGRRRALGATRSAIIVLVVTHTAAGGLLGVLVGSIAGLVAVWRLAGSLPSPAFVVAVATLGLLTAVLASIPPALAAAFRDPVRILRVP